MNYVLFALPVAALAATVFFSVRAVKNGKKSKSVLASQLLAFMVVCVVTVSVPLVANAAAPEEAAPTASQSSVLDSSVGMGLLSAALATGLAGIGGGIAVAAAAPAAIGATAEDAKSFGKSLIFVALGEGIALYGLLVSILILNKV